jgi:cyclophilin family peptidyl-prolyl cis-trans isomerase
VGTQKRERQKLNKLQKVAEDKKAEASAARKRQTIKIASIIAVAAIAIIAFSLSQKKDPAKVTTAATSTTIEGSATTVAGATTVVGAPTSDAVATTAEGAAMAGKTITGDTPCPKADGSEEKAVKFSTAPPTCIDPAKTYTATVETTKGTYKALLDAKKAPKTVNNFVVLARYHFFDATPCHRILKGFMAQCGDPTGKGSGGPGYEFADELPKDSKEYQPGTLAMANSGANTNGSQFFTMFREGLQPQYSIFGKVIEGMDTTVKAIEAVGAASDPSPPTEPVSITKVTITES